MAGSLLPTPAPDFSQGLELLHACHGRIEAQCATLLRLPAHLRAHGSDPQAQQAAQAVLRYFLVAAPHHHEDEEQDLFPMLRSMDAANALLLDDLSRQHRELEAAWQAVRPWLEKVARGEPVDPDSALVEHLVAQYRAHIAQEEAELLPYCRQALSREQQAELGERMAARRGASIGNS